jgi:hypothetical protein
VFDARTKAGLEVHGTSSVDFKDLPGPFCFSRLLGGFPAHEVFKPLARPKLSAGPSESSARFAIRKGSARRANRSKSVNEAYTTVQISRSEKAAGLAKAWSRVIHAWYETYRAAFESVIAALLLTAARGRSLSLFC